MDPLSITASVLTVVGAAKAIGVGLNELRLYSGASAHLARLINEVAEIQLVLHAIVITGAEAVKAGRARDEDFARLKPLAERTKETVKELTNILDSIKPKGGSNSVRKKPFSTKAWFLHRRKAFECASRLRDHRKDLHEELSTTPTFQQLGLHHDVQAMQFSSTATPQIQEGQSTSPGPSSPQPTALIQSISSTPLHGANDSEDSQGAQELSFETFSWSKPCNQSCRCQCHGKSTVRTSTWFRDVVGTLFIGYSGSPRLGTRPCNDARCNRSDSSIRLLYVFPAWVVAKAVRINATWGITLPGISLKVYTVIDDTYGIWDVIKKDNKQFIWKLFEVRDFSLTDVSESGETYLHYAVEAKSFKIIKFLLDHGLDIHAPDSDNRTPARLAWQLSRRNISDDDQMILRDLCDDDDDIMKNYGFGLLHKIVIGLRSIALLDEWDVVGPLLDNPDSHGWTPLHWAASYGDADMLKKLISLRANLNPVNHRGESPLHLAVTEGYTECARILVDAGASISIKTAQLETPLHRAATQPGTFPDVLDFLIDPSSGIDVMDESKCTPLTEAARHNNLPGVQALLARGANKNHANINENTPLSTAIGHNATEAAVCLCNHGADLTAVNVWGYNILHQIAYGGGYDIMCFLKDADLTGVDPELKDEEGIIPWEAFTMWRDMNFSGESVDKDEELAAFRHLVDKARAGRPNSTAVVGPQLE